jgi:hypothetical protein
LTLLKFLTLEENLGSIPEPYSAAEYMPPWFKNMNVKTNPDKQSFINNVGIKACPGIHDILKLGYIVPSWCDFYLETTDTDIRFESSTGEKFFEMFPSVMSNGYPFPEGHINTFVRLKSPWKVQSASNVSLLISQPKLFHHPFYQVCEGSLDLGNHISDIHFILSVKRNSYIEFKKGEPLLQLIPFVNTEFSSKVLELDDKKIKQWKKEYKLLKSISWGGFFKSFHRKKIFK